MIIYSNINIPEVMLQQMGKEKFTNTADLYWSFERKLKRRLNADERTFLAKIATEISGLGRGIHPLTRGTNQTYYAKIASKNNNTNYFISKNSYNRDKDISTSNEDFDDTDFDGVENNSKKVLPPREDMRGPKSPMVKEEDNDLLENKKEKEAMLLKTSKAEIEDLKVVVGSKEVKVLDARNDLSILAGYDDAVATEIIRDGILSGDVELSKTGTLRLNANINPWEDPEDNEYSGFRTHRINRENARSHIERQYIKGFVDGYGTSKGYDITLNEIPQLTGNQREILFDKAYNAVITILRNTDPKNQTSRLDEIDSYVYNQGFNYGNNLRLDDMGDYPNKLRFKNKVSSNMDLVAEWREDKTSAILYHDPKLDEYFVKTNMWGGSYKIGEDITLEEAINIVQRKVDEYNKKSNTNVILIYPKNEKSNWKTNIKDYLKAAKLGDNLMEKKAFDIPKLETIKPNFYLMRMHDKEVYFSYKTPIAFVNKDGSGYVSKNEWGPTTGKHINYVKGLYPNLKIVDNDELKEIAKTANKNSKIGANMEKVLQTNEAEVKDLTNILKRGSVQEHIAALKLRKRGYAISTAKEIIRDAQLTGYVKKIGSKLYATDKGWLDLEGDEPKNNASDSLSADDFVIGNEDNLYYNAFADEPGKYVANRRASRTRRAYDANVTPKDSYKLQSSDPTFDRFDEEVTPDIQGLASDLASGKKIAKIRKDAALARIRRRRLAEQHKRALDEVVFKREYEGVTEDIQGLAKDLATGKKTSRLDFLRKRAINAKEAYLKAKYADDDPTFPRYDAQPEENIQDFASELATGKREARLARARRIANLRRRAEDERKLQSSDPTFDRFDEEVTEDIPRLADDLATGAKSARQVELRRRALANKSMRLRRVASACPDCSERTMRRIASEPDKCAENLAMEGYSKEQIRDACGKINRSTK